MNFIHRPNPFLGQEKMNAIRKKYHRGYRAVGVPNVHLDFPSHFSSGDKKRLDEENEMSRGCYFALFDIDVLGRNILLCI